MLFLQIILPKRFLSLTNRQRLRKQEKKRQTRPLTLSISDTYAGLRKDNETRSSWTDAGRVLEKSVEREFRNCHEFPQEKML